MSTELVHLQEKANAHNDKLCSEIEGIFEAEILTRIDDLNSNFSELNLNNLLQILRLNADYEVCQLFFMFIIILSILESLFLNFEKKTKSPFTPCF